MDLRKCLVAVFVSLLGSAAFAQFNLLDGSAFGIDPIYMPRFSYTYQTGPGRGYRTGFSSFDAFVPWPDGDGTSIIFSDLRLLLSDTSNVGANLGGGFRMLNPAGSAIYGANLYYDNRDTGNFTYSQISGGLEYLRENVDFLFHFYVPVGQDRKEFVSFVPCNGQFVNRHIVLTRVIPFEIAMNSFDFEVGGILPFADGVDPRGYVGYYYLASDSGDANGIRGRIELMPIPNLAMNLQVTHDTVFDTTISFNVAVYSGSLRQMFRGRRTLRERLNQPVQRQQNIIVDRQFDTRGEVALSPTTGQPILVTHFNSAAAPGGDGSVNRPFNMLPNGTVSGDILFAHANSVFTNQFIVLQDGQRFLGEGTLHTFVSQFGTCTLPRATNGTVSPMIVDAPPIAAVTLANNTEVAGFTFSGLTPNIQIDGDNINNVIIRSNQFLNSNSGIDLFNVGGNVLITNNTFNNMNDVAIRIDERGTTQSNVQINNNTLSNLGSDGVVVTVQDNANVVLTADNNTVDTTSFASDGFFVDVSGNGTLNATVSNSTFQNISGQSLNFTARGTATLNFNVTGNLFQTGSSDAVSISLDVGATANGTISNNTFQGITGDGIEISANDDTTATFLISSNVFNSIGQSAVNLQTDDDSVVTARVLGNVVTSTGADGFDFDADDDSTLSIQILDNTFQLTGVDAIDADTEDEATICAQVFRNTTNQNFRFAAFDDGTFNLETTGGGAPTFGNTLQGGATINLNGVTLVPVGTCGFPAP
ncbi:MAG: hypothetical protein KatS3mg105_1936 [Gemmatales bacterium]|nr:MAG: hypothetical protein KatS3mg105_1936 [Gemmatales bacterium]